MNATGTHVPPLIVFSKVIIKTRPFPCKRHIFQDHEFACHVLDGTQDKRIGGAGNEISRSGTLSVSFHIAIGGKVQQTSDPFLTKHQNVLLPYVKQKKSRASCAKPLTASPCRKHLWECQEKKSFSLLEKLAIKRLFGTKRKGPQMDKVGIQKSSSESDMEIEFANDYSGGQRSTWSQGLYRC